MTTECEQLRVLVQDCIEKHLYTSAAFFAEKLVTLSNAAPPDVYLLAQTLYVSHQYRRALHLLQLTNLMETDARFRYLGAKCLAACKQWEECLAMLGDGEGEHDMSPEELEKAGLMSAQHVGWNINMYSAICLLRGQVFLALENRPRAIRWLKAAVTADPFCQEAMSLLSEGHLLTGAQEQELLASIKFPEDARWLELMYRCQCKKYEQEDKMESYLEELERNPALQDITDTARAAESASAEPSADTKGQEVARLPGCRFTDNSDVLACRADWHHHRGQYQECYALTSRLLERDPYHMNCLPVHLAAALQLQKKSELFIRGHRLVEEYPDRAVAWFAVGCYYTCTGQHDVARRYFGKCTAMEPSFAPGWVAFGNAFAALDESDQAMSAYRAAARLFPGLHLPVLGIGMEYQRMNNHNLAKEMYLQVRSICPRDPLVCNELGVLMYRNREYRQAEEHLRRALALLPAPLSKQWEPTVVNLGHVLRKQRRYEEALECYTTAQGLLPTSASTFVAIAYTNQLMGNLETAIECYHKALGLRPEDSFAADMLTAALTEECSIFSLKLADDDRQLPPNR